MSYTHEIQNREKHRTGDADHSAVCAEVCSELYPNLYRDETAVRLIDEIDYDFSEAEKNSDRKSVV